MTLFLIFLCMIPSMVKPLFFMFLSNSDKARFHQLEIITGTAARSTSFFESFHACLWPIRKGTCLCWGCMRSLTKLIKHIKLSYLVASLVFRRFSCVSYRNGLHERTSNLRYSKYFKKYELCRYNTFWQKIAF